MRIIRIALIALVGLISWSAAVNAEQQNSIIHSGDYDSFRVSPNRGWGACQRACKGDPRCRAWTFIKPGRQCRLKYSAGQSTRNNCCVSGVKRQQRVGAGRRRGGQQRFCSDYATEAVSVNEANLANRCRYRGRSWDANYVGHYQACLRLSRDRANDLAGDRRRMIKECSSHGDSSKEARCNHYVRVTGVQIATNQRAGCGFRGRRWADNDSRHRRRCMNNTGAVSSDATLRRERKIRRCLGIR